MHTRLYAQRLFPCLSILFLAVACGRTTPTQPASTSNTDTSSIAVAPQGEGSALIASVRQATAAFHDIDKAIDAGYVLPAVQVCDSSPAGTMGVHVPNPTLISAFPVIPEQPEVLLYIPRPDGSLRLVAVEYFQPVLLRNTETGVVAPWFAPTPWPSTYVVVNPAPSLFGQTFQGPMAGHVPGMPWHYDLHVWAWAPNPNGTFAQWNPSISCPS